MAELAVLVVDDHPIVCEGIRLLLSRYPDVRFVGKACNGLEAITRVDALRPDVVIMDVAMPVMNGVEATRQICRRFPGTRVLIFTPYDDRQHVLDLLKAGATGMVLKQGLVSNLVDAIRAVGQGEMFLYPAAARIVTEELCHTPVHLLPTCTLITFREREVLQRIVRGETSIQIAAALCLSVKTVESHRAHLMSKLGARNLATMVRQAIELGLVDEQERFSCETVPECSSAL